MKTGLVNISTLLSILGFLIGTADSFAQKGIPDDTLYFPFEKEVVITATRFPASSGTSPAPVEIFNSEGMQNAPVRTSADILRIASAVNVQSYGADGSLQLASLRGLGAEYTVVYLNGIRLNNAQNGLVDMGRISLQGVERIDISRGGMSSFYGANALGGVVNITTGSGSAPLAVSLGSGSFGRMWIDAAASGSGSFGQIRVSGSYEEARNDYPFVQLHDDSQNEIIRQNADLTRRKLMIDGRMNLGSSVLSFYGDIAGSEVGLPGAYMQDRQGRARQKDHDVFGALTFRTPVLKSSLLSILPTYSLSRQQYTDPLIVIGGKPLSGQYDNTAFGCLAQFDTKLSSEILLTGGTEFGYAHLQSEDVAGTPARFTAAAFASCEFSPSLFGKQILFYPAARYEFTADSSGNRSLQAFTPSLGAHVEIIENLLALRARAGSGFRVPTFNQLYWKQGGNPSLDPEFSWTIDAGVQFRPWQSLSFEVTAFHHDIKDKIVWSPDKGIYWTPKNIHHVVSNGLEGSITGNLMQGIVSFRLNAQWGSARKVNESFPGDATAGKMLIYTPVLSGSALVELNPLEWLSFSAVHLNVGDRYSSETNSPSSVVPAYSTTDVAATARFSFSSIRWALKTEVLNVFDVSYEVIAFYPMPPRSWRISVTTAIQ